MCLIIYSKDINKNEYGIKQISNSLFKKLMYNEIHKRCTFSIPIENIINEFGKENIDLTKFKPNSTQHLNSNSNIIENKNLDLDFDFDLNLDLDLDLDHSNTKPTVNVLYMNELNLQQLETYLEIYQDEKDTLDTLDKFTEFLSIIIYNQINLDRFRVKKKMNLLLNSLSEYWEDPYNCNYTLTYEFNKRKFNYKYNSFEKNIIKNISHNFEINWNAKEINYLNDIIKFEDNKEIQTHKYYLSSNESKFTCSDIIQIYIQLSSEYMKYMFISNMLCSYTHCHLILNNKEFLKISQPLFTKYKLIFKYLIGYAWITLKNAEEYKITDISKVIFDIDTVELLPVYPFTFDDINQNPYACLLIDSNIMNIKKNCLSMEMMKDYEKYYGICNLNEFKRRLNIFVNNKTNNEIKNILENIDWDCCAISGSIMTACGMKRNPLMDICKIDNNIDNITDNDLLNYFFHYYNNSDVDLICNKISIYDFIDVVNNFILKTKITHKNVSVSNIHSSSMFLSDEFILKELETITKTLDHNKFKIDQINVEFVKANFNNLDIKKYFYSKYYLPWKKEQKYFLMSKLLKLAFTNNDTIKDYLKPITENEFRLYSLDYKLNSDENIVQDYEKYFYLSSEKSNLSEESNLIIAKLSENIRFKISTLNTKTFEIFKTKDENFFSVVSRFHMSFVRAIWNGKTLLCLPSYISSLMLQFSNDYKYFASIRNPIEIINKYRSRGFGIILNNYEKLHMAYYNSCKNKNDDSNSKWIEMYKINIKSKQSIENIFGTKKSTDDIFKPSKYFQDISDNCFKNINHNTSSSFEECFYSLLNPSLFELGKFKAINDNGKINPLSKDIINLGWKLLNK